MVQTHHTLARVHGTARPLRRAVEIRDQISIALKVQIALGRIAAAAGNSMAAGPFGHPAIRSGGVEHDEVVVALVLHDDAAVEGDERSGVGDYA